jgi:ankyrin repeat protein
MLSHTKLLNQLKELGHIVKEKGVCYGLASMGLQAILLNDIQSLKDRLDLLAEIPENKLQDAIRGAEEHRAAKHRIAKKALQEKLQKKWGMDPADEKISFEKRLALENQAIYFKELSDSLTKADEELDKKDHILLSIRAFFDGIAVYFNPRISNLFEVKPNIILIPNNKYEEIKSDSNQIFVTLEKGGLKCKVTSEGETQDIIIDQKKLLEKFGIADYKNLAIILENNQQDRINPFSTKIREILFDTDPTLKKNLQPLTQDAASTFSRVLPDKLLEQKTKNQTFPAIFTMPPWTGIYNKDELFSYFKLLEKEFKDQKITEPVAFILGNSFHAITVGWDPKSQLWHYVDAEALEKITEEMDPGKLTSTLLENFSPDGITATFATSVYGNHAISGQLELAIKKCQSSDTWKLIHSLKDNKLKNDNISRLYLASMLGDIEMVKLLLQQGIKNDDIRRHNGSTPLHVASKNGHTAIVNLLLTHGAAIDNQTTNKLSALFLAARSGNYDIVELLLKKNPYIHEKESLSLYIDQRTHEGMTPLYAASSDGHSDVVELLINHGANINAMEGHNRTPLFVACEKGHVNVVKLLLQKGAHVNYPIDPTLLFIASLKGHSKVMEELLKRKEIVVNTTITSHISNLIQRATITNRIPSLEKLLIIKGVQDKKSIHDFSALHAAACYGHVEAVKTLLSHGADPYMKSEYNISPLELAKAMGHNDICDVLHQKMTALKQDKIKKFLTEVITEYKAEDTLTKRKKELLGKCINILENPQEEKNINNVFELALCVSLQMKSSWDPRGTTKGGLQIRELLNKPEYAVIADAIKLGSNKINYEDLRNFAMKTGIDSTHGSSKTNASHFFKVEPIKHFDEIEKHLNKLLIKDKIFQKELRSP